MDNLQKINNDLQYSLVRNTLDLYREIVLDSTKSFNSKFELCSAVGHIDQLLTDIEDCNINQLQAFQSFGYKVKESLEKEIKSKQDKQGIEIIINQHNGSKDIIIPVKNEDISDNYLAKLLYEYIQSSCDEYEFEKKVWEGYMVFSIVDKDNRIDKINLSRQICSSVPEELGGGNIVSKHKIYLRVANNFSFKYEPDSIKLDESVKKVKSNQIISREDAITLFRSGISNQDILKMFPGTHKMTVAGWKSAYTKGMYQ